MSDIVTDVKACQWYAGGRWRDVCGDKLFDDFEPYTGNLYARVAECGGDEARLAITAAAPMGGVRSSGWGRTGPQWLADFSVVVWIDTTSAKRQFPF
jgi:acyl-CoA reductase-like NAD-dependent aldehyde dehydrogenase